MTPTLTSDQINTYATMLWTRTIAFLPDLITAVVIVVVGWALAAWVARSVGKILDRSGRVDVTARPVIITALRYSILLLVLIVGLTQVGVETASLLAVLGTAGLAIGLALQGTLTNIAAGIMLLWLRPFRVGAVGNAAEFKHGRELAASLGLVPRHRATGWPHHHAGDQLARGSLPAQPADSWCPRGAVDDGTPQRATQCLGRTAQTPAGRQCRCGRTGP